MKNKEKKNVFTIFKLQVIAFIKIKKNILWKICERMYSDINKKKNGVKNGVHFALRTDKKKYIYIFI